MYADETLPWFWWREKRNLKEFKTHSGRLDKCPGEFTRAEQAQHLSECVTHLNGVKGGEHYERPEKSDGLSVFYS